MKSLHPLDSTLTEYKKDEISFNFERYIQTLLDNKWRILLFVLTVLVASYFIINSIKTQYKATATILIEKKESNVVDVTALYGLDNESEEYLATEFEVLRSRPLAEKVVEKLDLTSHPAFKDEQGFSLLDFVGSIKGKVMGSDQPSDQALTNEAVEVEIARRELLKDYQERLSVFPMRKTQLVEVSFEAPTPVLARDIANEHAEAYIEADLEARLERTKTAASWLAGQVEGLKGELSSAEQQLADYVEQENVIDIEGIQAVSSQELKDLNTELVKVRAKLSEATIRREQVQSARRSNSEESLPSVQSDNVAQTLKLDVVLAQQKRAELGKRYGPEHPRMLAATSDLTTARSGFRDQINKIIERVEFEYNAALAEEADLQRRINLAQQTFFSDNRKGSKYLELQREVESNQRLFDLFYNRTKDCLLYTSPSPRDLSTPRMPSSA